MTRKHITIIDDTGRDLKGSVTPHPAIKIDIEATKLIADLFKKFE